MRFWLRTARIRRWQAVQPPPAPVRLAISHSDRAPCCSTARTTVDRVTCKQWHNVGSAEFSAAVRSPQEPQHGADSTGVGPTVDGTTTSISIDS